MIRSAETQVYDTPGIMFHVCKLFILHNADSFDSWRTIMALACTNREGRALAERVIKWVGTPDQHSWYKFLGITIHTPAQFLQIGRMNHVRGIALKIGETVWDPHSDFDDFWKNMGGLTFPHVTKLRDQWSHITHFYAKEEPHLWAKLLLGDGMLLQDYLNSAGKVNVLFIKFALWENGMSFQFLPLEHRTEGHIDLALRGNPLSLGLMPVEIRNDHARVLETVRRNGDALQYATLPLRNNPEIALAALRNASSASVHAGPAAWNDPAFVERVRSINADPIHPPGFMQRVRFTCRIWLFHITNFFITYIYSPFARLLGRGS